MSSIIEKAVEKLERDAPAAPAVEAGGPAVAAPAPRDERRDDDAPPVEARAEPTPDGEPPSVAPGAGVVPPAALDRSNTVDLDLARLERLGYVTPESAASALLEELRLLKRQLLMRVGPAGTRASAGENLIMVTSSLPNEGKTFVSVNLSMSIAMELDRTVLLVDADAAKSDASRLMGVADRGGLTDYLSGDVSSIAEVLVRTSVPKLSVLPAGRQHARVTELMASEHMRRLASELAQRYDDRVIVFDSPPLLATSGASVLSACMGQIVLVVEAVRTSQSAVRDAIELIGTHDNIGLVLNKSRQPRSEKYRYYGYYYGA